MDLFRKIAELKDAGVPFALVTLIASAGSTPRKRGARMVVFPDGSGAGTVGGGAVERLAARDAAALLAAGEAEPRTLNYDLGKKGRARTGESKTGMICGGKVEVLVEPFQPALRLVVCGGGHIGEKLAALADALEVEYAVIDNRKAFANRKRFPRADEVVCAPFAAGLRRATVTAQTAIVIVTYGHQHDDVCLRAALATPAAYIGMIGSRKKVGAILKRLAREGHDTRDRRIHSPVGLDIGREAPAEIALSILAEIYLERNRGTGRPMRDVKR